MDGVIKDICVYILDNIDDEIRITTLEKKFYYNKFYIIRAFKKVTGFTIKEFINTIKVLKIVDPLLFTNDTILKIALNHGFNSQEYYSETFRGVIGISPLSFRKEFKNIEESNDIKELERKRNYLLYLKDYYRDIRNIYNSPNNKRRELKKAS